MAENKDRLKIEDILKQNINKNFIQRIFYPEVFPKLDLGNGAYATHKMAWGSVNSPNGTKYIVFPTVVPNNELGGKSLIDLSTTGVNPLGRALQSNDYVEFNSAEEADWFSKNYKKFWNTGEQ